MGALRAGDVVVGLTGHVITFRPGRVRIDRDLPDGGLHRGNIILTYVYHGEGETSAWHKGVFYDAFDISFARYPDGGGCQRDCYGTVIDGGDKEWWAQVRLKSGRTRWVFMDEAIFDGVDYYS
jgi:hypothetical protein